MATVHHEKGRPSPLPPLAPYVEVLPMDLYKPKKETKIGRAWKKFYKFIILKRHE